MKKFIGLVAMVGTVLQLTGCGHFIFDTKTDRGIGFELGIGLDDPRAAEYQLRGGRGGDFGGYRMQRQPGQATLEAMTATEPLVQWASGDGEGTQRRHGDCSAYESGQWASYNCSAGHSGSSLRIDGQIVPPRQGYGGGGSYQQPMQQQYGNQRGGYGNSYR